MAETANPAPTLMNATEAGPPVHPLAVRITHWINALAVLIMIGSGWQIYNASPLFGFSFPGAVTLGGWLAGGIVLFSAMHGLHPRYLEALAPAVALVLGSSLALGTRLLPSRRAGAVVALGALAAVLVPSTIAAATAVRDGISDSGRPGYIAPARAARLSAFLRAHQGTARYELASIAPAKAAQVMARDGHPALILEAYYGQPLVGVPSLAAAVRSGAVRYALLGSTCSPHARDRLTGCSPDARWIRAHGVDVSRAAGQPDPGLVYRLSGA